MDPTDSFGRDLESSERNMRAGHDQYEMAVSAQEKELTWQREYSWPGLVGSSAVTL